MSSDPKTYLDIAIEDYEPSVKAKIYEIVLKSKIPQNDPFITIFLANAQVAATVATAPDLMRDSVEKSFSDGLGKIDEYLITLRKTSVKEQEKAINLAIANVIKNNQGHNQGKLPLIGFCVGALVIGLVAGLISGMAIAKSSATKNAEWAESSDGKMAKNLVVWNRDILKTCVQDQKNLKEALIFLNGKYVTKGLCALWVLPENQRVYEDRR
jgi:dienelactone hydrolase